MRQNLMYETESLKQRTHQNVRKYSTPYEHLGRQHNQSKNSYGPRTVQRQKHSITRRNNEGLSNQAQHKRQKIQEAQRKKSTESTENAQTHKVKGNSIFKIDYRAILDSTSQRKYQSLINLAQKTKQKLSMSSHAESLEDLCKMTKFQQKDAYKAYKGFYPNKATRKNSSFTRLTKAQFRVASEKSVFDIDNGVLGIQSQLQSSSILNQSHIASTNKKIISLLSDRPQNRKLPFKNQKKLIQIIKRDQRITPYNCKNDTKNLYKKQASYRPCFDFEQILNKTELKDSRSFEKEQLYKKSQQSKSYMLKKRNKTQKSENEDTAEEELRPIHNLSNYWNKLQRSKNKLQTANIEQQHDEWENQGIEDECIYNPEDFLKNKKQSLKHLVPRNSQKSSIESQSSQIKFDQTKEYYHRENALSHANLSAFCTVLPEDYKRLNSLSNKYKESQRLRVLLKHKSKYEAKEVRVFKEMSQKRKQSKAKSEHSLFCHIQKAQCEKRIMFQNKKAKKELARERYQESSESTFKKKGKKKAHARQFSGWVDESIMQPDEQLSFYQQKMS